MIIYGQENVGGKPWIDFSSLSILMRCPRWYYWRVKRNLTTAGGNSALINGKAYHESRATYRQGIIDGKSHIQCKKEALESIYPIMAEIVEDDPVRNISVALDTLDNYFDRWEGDSYKPLLVEIGFAFLLPESDYIVVGKIDEFAQTPFGDAIIEFKTTTIVGERWHSRASQNLQIDIYVTGIYLNTGTLPFGGVIDVVPLHKDKSKRKPPFRIGPSPRSEEDIDLCISDITAWCKTLTRYEEERFFPRITETCVPLIGFKCPYLLLCNLNKNPYKGDIQVPAEYKEESWAPFEALNIIKEGGK